MSSESETQEPPSGDGAEIGSRSLEGLHGTVPVPPASAGFWKQYRAFVGPAFLKTYPVPAGNAEALSKTLVDIYKSSQIIRIGSGCASPARRSTTEPSAPAAATASSRSPAMAVTRGSIASVRRCVKLGATSLRSRVWSEP